tara:strand:+ start:582 stop:1538 length:957 start_codon:yes stop_codon:yes gene_type:complete
MEKEKKLISIIAPCFNEELNIEIFYKEIKSVFKILEDYEYELIFADDSSTDETVNIIKKLCTKDHRIKLIVNARNYGVYRNTFNAIKYANGQALVPNLPVDLQDPPSLIVEFIEHWEKGEKVIVGTRKNRDEFFIYKFIRSIYYNLASKFSDYKLIKYGGEYGLLDSSIYRRLLLFDDHYPYTRGLIASLSDNIVEVPYFWEKRKHGKSNYNFFKYYDHGINGIISTSRNILRKFTFLGVIFSMLLFIFIIYQFYNFIFLDRSLIPPGTLTLLLIVTFFSFFTFVSISVLSEYIIAIHSQVRNNVGVIEKELLNIKSD